MQLAPHAMDIPPRHISWPSTSPMNPNPTPSEFNSDVEAASLNYAEPSKLQQTLRAESADSTGYIPRFVASLREDSNRRWTTQRSRDESEQDKRRWEKEVVKLKREQERLRHEARQLDDDRRMSHDALGKFLEGAGWPDFKVGDDPIKCILEFARHLQSLVIENSESFQKAESRRTALEEQVQDLTSRLADSKKAGRDLLKKAVQDQSTSQAEIKRLQGIIDTQHDKYRDALQSENERHSATVDRLINEHTAEMSEQMSSYEKELVELRMAHDRGLAQREQRHRLELDLLHDKMMALEGSLKEKPTDPPVVADESTMRQADKPVKRDSFKQMEKPVDWPVETNDSTMQTTKKLARRVSFTQEEFGGY